MAFRPFTATKKQLFSVSKERLEFGAWRILLTSSAAEAKQPLLVPRQAHGGNIARAAELATRSLEADGVFIEEPNFTVGVSTADCAPVALLGDRQGLLLHVSRKTLTHGLLENAFSYLAPSQVNYVYVGPHICEYHFSFEREEADLKRFRVRFPQAVHFHQRRLHLSLRTAIESVLREWDIHPRRVAWDGRCTFEHEDLPSYRRLLSMGLSVHSLPSLHTIAWRE